MALVEAVAKLLVVLTDDIAKLLITLTFAGPLGV